MVVLCACLFIACEKDNDDYEPVKPPVEQPENPVEPEKPDEPEKPEKPAIPPSTDNIINFKIGDLNFWFNQTPILYATMLNVRPNNPSLTILFMMFLTSFCCNFLL